MGRRDDIADAAIDVLATDGARGLTHRAVDRRLDLPRGSTSYYFRTREALLAAVADRLVELDRADVDRFREDPEGLAVIVDHWLRPANRSRLVARFELFLTTSRSSDAPLAAARAAFREQVVGVLAAAGASEPRIGATAVIATAEGLLLDGLLGGRHTKEERHEIVRLALRSAVRRPPG